MDFTILSPNGNNGCGVTFSCNDEADCNPPLEVATEGSKFGFSQWPHSELKRFALREPVVLGNEKNKRPTSRESFEVTSLLL